MKKNDFQKPESIEIPYNREELEKVIALLLRGKEPKYTKKKEKVLAYVDTIEKEIAKITQYQTMENPEKFYSNITASLSKIKSIASSIYECIKYNDESLPNTLRQLILESINPLEETLKNIPTSSDIVFKTKRLYAQQSFVCRQWDLQERLVRHLKTLKKFLLILGEPPPCCYISYASPSEKRKEEEYWVQPFLYVLYDHLAAAGIRVVMDIRDNNPGDSIFAFMKQYYDSNYIILVGTESLLDKHYDERAHAVQTELSIITNRFEEDQKIFNQSRIYPLLINGTIKTVYPEIFDKYHVVQDGREADYLKMLKDLTDWIYKFRLGFLNKEAEYTVLWNEYFDSIPNLPNDIPAVEEEILQNYHKPRYIEDLKQNRKTQASSKEYGSSSSSSLAAKMKNSDIAMFPMIFMPDEQKSVQQIATKNDKSIGASPEKTGILDESSSSSVDDGTQTTIIGSKFYKELEITSEASGQEELSTEVHNSTVRGKANIIKKRELSLGPALLEASNPNSNIINVSGFDNCCGLFALALAIKIEMREKGACKNQLPAFFDTIDEEALKQATKDTEYIGKQLREEMCSALLSDEAYKERRFHSFVEYCRATIEGSSLPEDMESFAEITQEYRESLKTLWLSVQEEIKKQFKEAKAEYNQCLETNKVECLLIDEVKQKLSQLVTSSPVHQGIIQLIDDNYKEESDLVVRLIKFNRLYCSAWLEIDIGIAEDRNRLTELYTEILNEKSLTLLEEKQGKEFIIALLKLSFLKKTSFKCDGQLEKICEKEEIISTAIFLLVRHDLRKEWNGIYQNYCKYIKENSVMLTADELGCLAHRWNVQLKIQFEIGAPYDTYQTYHPTLIHVTLCNLSQDHWQVLCHKMRIEKDITNINQNESIERTVVNISANDVGSIISEESVNHHFLKGTVEKIKSLEEIPSFDREEVKANRLNGNKNILPPMAVEKETDANQSDEERGTALILSALNGHEAMVAQLLEKEAEANQADKGGFMALIWAVAKGHESVVAQLLEKGADINQADENGGTMLMIAALNGHEAVAAQLLEKGADINQADKKGGTALMKAAENRHEAVVAQLLEKGADINQADKNGRTALYIAAARGHQTVVAELLEKGADINQADENGWTALYIAVHNGHEAVVVQLLEKGAEVDQANRWGWTALMEAAANGREAVVVQLLEKGADINQANKNGRTVLIEAAEKGYQTVVAQLLEKGAEVNRANRWGWTALMEAAAREHQTVVAQLLEKGTDINQADKNGWTALMEVAARGHQTVVAQLLEKRADVNQADENGWTALMIAAARGHQTVVAQLLEKGADINQTDENGRTALMWAAANGHEAVVAQLLEKEGDVNQKSKYGKTLLALAIDGSHFKVIALLLSAGAKIEDQRKRHIALLYPHLQKWLWSGEYKACLIVSDYRLRQEANVRIKERVTAYYAQGKLDEAVIYLDGLAKKGRKEDTAFIAHKRGYIKMERGELEGAIADYEAALRVSENDYCVRYDRMQAELYKTGNPEVVLAWLEQLPSPKTSPDKQEAIYTYHVRGFIYHQCLQYEEALDCFNEGLKRNKEDIFTLAKQGFLFLCQGEREKGFNHLDAALAINPYYSGALARKGYGLALEGDLEEAGEYFKRSLAVNPTHFETLLLKGVSLILQKSFPKKAKKCIEKTFEVSITRSLLIAQHMPEEVKEFIGDYAVEYSKNDKKKLKNVLLVLSRLAIFSQNKEEKIESYLTEAYLEDELNVLLREVSEDSLLYGVLYRIVLNNARKHQVEKEQRKVDFETKQRELSTQLEEITLENPLAIQKEIIQEAIKQLVMTKEPVDDLRRLLDKCVEPNELVEEYHVSFRFRRKFITKENFLINQLAGKIQAIDEFIKKYPSISYQEVKASLKIIRGIYADYQENETSFPPKEREKQRIVLYAPRYRLSMAFFQDRYLKEEVQSCLAPHEGEIEEKRGETSYGTHIVKRYKEMHFKYHDKTNPCYPVIEYMIGRLYSLLAGLFYGTAPTEIVKLHRKGYARVLVASQTLKGINLFDFLTHYVKNEPECIKQFDSHSFSTMIITSLLSNPVDGKADNYMVQFFKNPDGDEKIKILGFDNDLAFGDPIVKIHQGKREGQHFVEVRNVFYFFPQMNDPIDPAICKRLITESPELLMLTFIQSLQKQDEYYNRLLEGGILTEEEGKTLQLPICFPRKETLAIMYKRLRAIQRCLHRDNQLSHRDLFQAIYPEMAEHYQKIAKQNQGIPNAILQNIAALYAASASTLEEANVIVKQKSLVTMSRLAIKTMEKKEYVNRRYSLSKAVESFVDSIEFTGMSLDRQHQVLKELKTLRGVEQLTLRDCEGLDDGLLRELVDELSSLKSLSLVRCSQMTQKSIIGVASPRGRKRVEIKIEYAPIKVSLAQIDKSEKAAGKEEEDSLRHIERKKSGDKHKK